jgi:hypothetical protein
MSTSLGVCRSSRVERRAGESAKRGREAERQREREVREVGNESRC